MNAQQITSNGSFLAKKTVYAHDGAISFDVIVRQKISKLCPPCQLVPTMPLVLATDQCFRPRISNKGFIKFIEFTDISSAVATARKIIIDIQSFAF